ncbi:MAG: hypothetical protein V8R51_07675 [Clostridia bacterium]
MKKRYIITKTIWQIFLYLFEVISISLFLTYLTTLIEDINSPFKWIERAIMCYTVYQILVLVILTNMNDIERDSCLAYIKVLKKCLLYIEMNEENIKKEISKEISKDILKDIDYQLDNGTFNNNEYRQAYALIRDNINNLNKNSIKIELIEAEHNYEMNALNWRFSFILRFLKK